MAQNVIGGNQECCISEFCLETETSVMLLLFFSAISPKLLPNVQVYYREEEEFEDNFLLRNWSAFQQSSN